MEDSLSWSRLGTLPLSLFQQVVQMKKMRPTKGYDPSENKRDINIEPKQPNLDESYVIVPQES